MKSVKRIGKKQGAYPTLKFIIDVWKFFGIEKFILRYYNMPFGVSILAVVKK